MNYHARQHELAVQHERIRALERTSSILSVECTGDAPDRYLLKFRGRGLHRDRATGLLGMNEEHQCMLRLPYGFPEQGPDVQWLTPIVHPNISFSGLVHLEDLGLPWTTRIGLEVVCERLWDAARMAYVDWHRVVNQSAARSLQAECSWAMPLDLRPLRDLDHHEVKNLVRYRRQTAAHENVQQAGNEIYYIDDVAVPIRDEGQSPLAAHEPRRHGTGEDVLYIGDDSAPES